MASNYQLGYDVDRFEKSVDENFHCLICYNVLKDPVMCWRNGHCFCRGCITEHLRRNGHRCPTCADELTIETLQDVPRFVKNYLNELNIRCDHYDRGCRELVQLQNFQRHVAECGFSPIVCRNQGCGEIVSKRDRIYHESELCQFSKTIIAGIEKKITNLDTKLEKINTIVEANFTNTDKELKKVQTKTNMALESMDKKLMTMNTKMISTNTKLEKMNAKIGNLQENVAATFGAVGREVRSIKMNFNELQDGFEHLKEAVLEKMESFERKQEEITARCGRNNQHILVAGGMRKKSVEILNYHQKLWSSIRPMLVDRRRATSFVYNNHVAVAGGLCCSRPVDDMVQMNLYSVPDLVVNWSDFAAKLPAKMYAHSSVVYKDNLFVSGGYNADQRVISNGIYEVQLKPPYTVKLVCRMPEPRVDHGTVACDDNILIVGGKKSWFSRDNLSSVLSYDIKKKNGRRLPALPYTVSEMAIVKWAENVVIIGGVDKDGNALNNVVIYNTKTGNSHVLPPMLHKRMGCAAVVIDNTIVVLGGRDERGNDLKSVEGFSFERFSWEELPEMEEARYQTTAVVICT